MDATNEVRAAVRDRRRDLGLTQEQMAARAGVSPRAYQNFEAGKGKPQAANLRAILKAAGIEDTPGALADVIREEWPRDVKVFLDMLGMYLMTMADADRLKFIHRITRDIFNGVHGVMKSD